MPDWLYVLALDNLIWWHTHAIAWWGVFAVGPAILFVLWRFHHGVRTPDDC